MHCDDIGTRQSAGYPEKLRNMHNIATQPFDDVAKLQVSLDCGIRLKQRDDVEVCGQVTDFRRGAGRANQEVIVRSIDSAECPYDIPGVSAHPEFRGPPDVDRDLHGIILIIVATTREF